eukprot:1156864-Pelagomonas_calceolata.AAC.5
MYTHMQTCTHTSQAGSAVSDPCSHVGTAPHPCARAQRAQAPRFPASSAKPSPEPQRCWAGEDVGPRLFCSI